MPEANIAHGKKKGRREKKEDLKGRSTTAPSGKDDNPCLIDKKKIKKEEKPREVKIIISKQDNGNLEFRL